MSAPSARKKSYWHGQEFGDILKLVWTELVLGNVAIFRERFPVSHNYNTLLNHLINFYNNFKVGDVRVTLNKHDAIIHVKKTKFSQPVMISTSLGLDELLTTNENPTIQLAFPIYLSRGTPVDKDDAISAIGQSTHKYIDIAEEICEHLAHLRKNLRERGISEK